VLEAVEREYGLGASQNAALDDRIRGVADYVFLRVAHALSTQVPPSPHLHLQMRAMFNAAFDYLEGLSDRGSAYERRLHERRLRIGRACLADLLRMQNFMVISEASLGTPGHAEQVGEVLFRLEKEVFGRARTLPLREAVVRVGEPIELAERLPAYRVNRKAAVAATTELFHARLSELLGSLAGVGTPL
jgi:hypothetical protein